MFTSKNPNKLDKSINKKREITFLKSKKGESLENRQEMNLSR